MNLFAQRELSIIYLMEIRKFVSLLWDRFSLRIRIAYVNVVRHNGSVRQVNDMWHLRFWCNGIVQETSEGNVVLGKGDLFLWQYRVYKNVVLTFATWELWNDYQREFKYNVWYCMFCEAKRLNRITQRLKCVQVYRIYCSGDLEVLASQ